MPASRLKTWTDAATNMPRITYVAMRFGFAPAGVRFVATLTSEGPVDLHWKVLGDTLVEVLRNSGPVLTKLGQILAVRDDLLPREVLDRLEQLYSKQPAMKEPQLERALRSAYPSGQPFDAGSLERKPLGVGSVGQVHRARLGGERVIVKLIRPGITREIERDMNTARAIVELVFSVPRLTRAARADAAASREAIVRALDELAEGFARETDLANEANALEDFGKRLRKNPDVRVPKCYRAHSTRDVLVMEELIGQPISSLKNATGEAVERAKQAADRALKEILTQVFVEGRFHADPHGGNLLVLEDGRIGLIDLGLTGELTGDDRKNISRAVRAFVKRDPDALIQALLGFGQTPDDFVYDDFRNDVVSVVKEHKGSAQAPSEGSLDRFVGALFKVARRHRVHVPTSASLLIKTLVTIEGVARSIDPEINLVGAAVPVILKSLTPSWLRWGR